MKFFSAKWNWKSYIRYFDATHETEHNWNYLQIPNQSKFLDIFEENLPKINTSYCEIYFLGDFNIDLFENGKYVFDKCSRNNKNLDSFTKKYREYCTLFGLKQLIKWTTRVTCNSSSILVHVLARFHDRVSQSGVIDVAYQIIS